MRQDPQTRGNQRIVHPPVTGGAAEPASVLSVVLEEDEEVVWLWTHFPDGRSQVTGYEVIKKGGERRRCDLEEAVTD